MWQIPWTFAVIGLIYGGVYLTVRDRYWLALVSGLLALGVLMAPMFFA